MRITRWLISLNSTTPEPNVENRKNTPLNTEKYYIIFSRSPVAALAARSISLTISDNAAL
jgi:phosphatidylserine decarboxylase